MSDIIVKWKIYCTTDFKWEYLWDLPTNGQSNCPTNGGHGVNLGSTSNDFESKYISITNAYTPYSLSTKSILADTSSGSIIINLPAHLNFKDKFFIIKKTSASNSLIIDPNGSETIDGNSTYTLSSLNETVEITSDGSEWVVYSPNDQAITDNEQLASSGSGGADIIETLLETKGSLLSTDGNELCEFPVGAENQILTSNSNNLCGLQWTDLNTITPSTTEVYIIKDIKSTGSNGGNVTANTWITRDLNNLVSMNGKNVSLSSNQFTIQPGKYLLECFAPAIRVEDHKAILYNITDSTTDSVGTSEYTNDNDLTGNSSKIYHIFNIDNAKTYEIRHMCNKNRSSYGLGIACGFSKIDEVYTIVTIKKL